MILTHRTTRPRLVSVAVTDPPDTALIEVSDAKKYLNITVGTSDDDLLERLIAAATRTVERKTHRALIDQQVTTRWRGSAMPLKLYRPPVQSVVSVTTYDQEADTEEDETDFYVDGGQSMRPRLLFKDGASFSANGVTDIQVVTLNGFGPLASDVPEELVQAAYLILSQFYDRRDNFVEGTLHELPYSASVLMQEWVVPVV
jgi:uncharacterized phiE125 gp8 family phage protein